MHQRRWIGLLAAFMGLAALASCGPGDEGDAGASTGRERLQVIATIGMIEDVARRVAGDRATVVGLLGPGVDPHLYSLTRSDVARLMEADVILYNGLMLEGKMTDALTRAEEAGKRVIAIGDAFDSDVLLEAEDEPGHPDPHVWMDPAAWATTVEVISEAFIASDPDGRAAYERNAAETLTMMESLDAYAVEVLESVPSDQRVLVTAHDAFNYFGARFGYEVVGIQGLSTESEAGVLDIERLVDMLVDRQISAVFVESTVSSRNIEALVAGAAARGQTVRIGGSLFSDAMGAPGTYRGTYEGMIDHNVTTITRALGGSAPDGGLHGKLED